MKKKNFLLYAGTVFIGVALSVRSGTALIAAKEALYLCAERVIPGLFPFFVLSSLWVRMGLLQWVGQRISFVAEKVLCISGNGAVAFIMGLVCGYPTGAKVIAELYETKQIKKQEAEKLLAFCNNSGPLFVIGVVGSMMPGSGMGLRLYGIHVISAVAVAMIFSCFSQGSFEKKEIAWHAVCGGRAFSESVAESVKTMLEVCGYIVIFSVVRRLFFSPNNLFFAAVSEVTAGAFSIAFSKLAEQGKVIALSGVIGFGGLCVMLQVWGIVSSKHIRIRFYAAGKILQGTLAALVAWNPKTVIPVLFGAILFFRILKLTKSLSSRIIEKKTQRRNAGYESLSVCGR